MIECKILRKSLERTVSEGLEQTAACMDRCRAESGHLVIFDRGDGRWEAKVFCRRERSGGTEIHVWGMQRLPRGGAAVHGQGYPGYEGRLIRQ